MNGVVWAMQILLAAVFLTSGTRTFARPTPELQKRLGTGVYRAVGALELLAAAGLVLPAVSGIAPVLIGLTAIGLILLMIGAAITNLLVRSPRGYLVVNAVLIVLAATVAWTRLGPVPL